MLIHEVAEVLVIANGVRAGRTGRLPIELVHGTTPTDGAPYSSNTSGTSR